MNEIFVAQHSSTRQMEVIFYSHFGLNWGKRSFEKPSPINRLVMSGCRKQVPNPILN